MNIRSKTIPSRDPALAVRGTMSDFQRAWVAAGRRDDVARARFDFTAARHRALTLLTRLSTRSLPLLLPRRRSASINSQTA